MKPIVYEGSEPYIFVSYAHKDFDVIFEVLSELQARGYRFWYDDGIAPGSEWPEDIAQHLDAAHVVVAFVTQNAMDSRNCRREINFSLSREKRFLSVLMEETEMPLGMQMQLSAQQSIVRYNYETWDGFIKKLLSCPDLAPCRDEAPQAHSEQKVNTALTTEAQAAHQKNATPPDAPENSLEEVKGTHPMKPAKAAESTTEIGDSNQPERTDIKQPETNKTSKQKLAIIVPAIFLLLAILVCIKMLLTTYRSSWGETIELTRTRSNLTVNGETITQKDLNAIARMESLRNLAFTNCDLSACDFSRVSFASKDLANVELSHCIGINDYSWLEDLSLEKLNLAGCEDFDSLDKLKLDNLVELDISSTAVNDITPLATASNLEKIVASNTQVNSLVPLFGLEKLTFIDFSGCNPIYIRVNLTSDTSFSSLSLETIRLRDSNITELDVFRNCTRLKELSLNNNSKVTDLSWLDEQNYETLQVLDLGRTALTAEDLDFIAQCPNLVALRLDGIALDSLDFVPCNNLEFLSAVNCDLTDISHLSSSGSLKAVFLSHNHITDVTPLEHMGEISTYNTVLDLSYNELNSASALKPGQYRALFLQGNPNGSEVTNTLSSEFGGHELITTWNQDIAKSEIARNRTFRCVYLLDCPQNEVLNAQEVFGGSLRLVSEDELAQILAEDSLESSLTGGYGYPLPIDFSYSLSLR